MILCLSALDGEIGAIRDRLDAPSDLRWKDIPAWGGELGGREVIVSRSGVGKSLAAAVSQALVDRHKPEAIIFSGLAGAIRPDLEIGDTLIAEDCLQYDLDATALGFERGEVPYSDLRLCSADPKLLEIARRFQPREGALAVGRVLTGDRFVTRKALSEMSWLREELDGAAVEMEGASVAFVAVLNALPFLLVRTISDKADTEARVDFERFLARASTNSADFLEFLLARL